MLTALVATMAAVAGAWASYRWLTVRPAARHDELSDRVGQLNCDVQSYDADVRALTAQVDSAKTALAQAEDDLRECGAKLSLYQQDLQRYRCLVTLYEQDQALISQLFGLAMELEPLEDQLKAWIGFADMPKQDREQATDALADQFKRLRDLRDKGAQVQTSELREWLRTVGGVVAEIPTRRMAEDTSSGT